MSPARKSTATAKASASVNTSTAAKKSERTNPVTGKLGASSFVSVLELADLEAAGQLRSKPEIVPKSGIYRVFVDDGDVYAVAHEHDESCSAVHPIKGE